MCCERRGRVRAIGAGLRRHGRLENEAFATGVRRRRLLRERGRVVRPRVPGVGVEDGADVLLAACARAGAAPTPTRRH